MTKEDQDKLETAFVDRYSIPTILSALQVICDLKAEHLMANWQIDFAAPLVRAWQNMGIACDRAEKATTEPNKIAQGES